MSGPTVKVETSCTVQGRDAQGQAYSLAPGLHDLAKELAEDLVARGHARAVGQDVADQDQDQDQDQDPADGDGKGEGEIDAWADEILAGAIPDVVAKLKGLTADQLEHLAEVESGGKARKGVLEAIAQAYDDAE